MEQAKLEELIKDMSLEEKAYQLFQIDGNYFVEGQVLTGPVAQLNITNEEACLSGSVLTLYGAKNVRRVQDMIMERQPHHIPAIFMYDVIHGLKTINPVPIGLGSTFNPMLVKEGCVMNAREAAVCGIHVVFSPMSDLCRDPRWGRVMEGTGEDKYLNGIYTKAMVEGYQGNNPKEKYKVGACMKHFAAYGCPEAGRDYNTVELSEHTLFEDYLPAYEAGVKAGCVSVMTSFNTIDRIPMSANRRMIRKVLREKMGFDGLVISDYAALAELVSHGVAEDKEEAACLAMDAGVDMDMMGACYGKVLIKMVEEGKIEESLINEAVMHVLQLKNQLGLFENPYKDLSEEEEATTLLCKEHREIARKTAEESFVLLENDGILPLKTEEQKIGIVGPYADMGELYGSWAIAANGEDGKSMKSVIERLYSKNDYVFADGCNIMPEGSLLPGLGSSLVVKYDESQEKEACKCAIEIAKNVDTVVMMLGEHRLQTGEAASVANIRIPNKQMELLRKVAEVNKNIVVVLFNGRPLILKEIKNYARAILEVWLPGTEGASAIADTLFGKVNPSGRLSMSFPYEVGQIPVHYDEFTTGRMKVEEFNKFCSRYEDIPNAPLYPFGYGLSYSEFTYKEHSLSKHILSMEKEDKIIVSVKVKNTSNVDGKEVVGLYIQDLKASVVRPKKELKGFQKIFLKAGEERTIVFEVKEEMLRFYNRDMEYGSEPGKFKIYIAHDSAVNESMEFELVIQ